MAELRIIGPVPEENLESGLRIIGEVPEPLALTARQAPAIVPPADVDIQDPARGARPYPLATTGAFGRLGVDIARSFGDQAPWAPAAAPDPVAPPDAVGPVRHYLGAAGQGAAGVLADIPKSLAISRYGSAQNVLTQFDRIERGELPKIGDLSSGQKGDVAEYFQYPKSRAALRAKYQTEGADPRTTGLYEAGEAFETGARELMPTDPAREGGFGTKLARGLGSTAGFLAGGITGRLVKLPALAAAAGTGAAVNASQQFQDALRSGAGLEDAYSASKLGAVVGTSEALPIVRLLDRFDKGTGGTIKRTILQGIKGGIEEGTQELGQRIADNLIASEVVKYDPERQTFEGTGEAGGVGFTVGALFNTIASMVGVRVRTRRERVSREAEREEPYLGRPSQEVEPAPSPGLPAPTEAPIPPGGPQAPVEAPAAPADTLAEPIFDALHPGLTFNKGRDGAWWRGKAQAVLDAPRTVEGVIEATVNEPWMIEKALANPSEVRKAQKVLDLLPPAPEARPQGPGLTIIGPAPATETTEQGEQGLPPAVAPVPSETMPGVKPEQRGPKVFRGYGREDRGKAYSGAALPILGEGRYYSFTREEAQEFGPEIEERELDLQNPLVIKSDDQWRALTKEAGWPFPNPFGLSEAEVAKHTAGLKDLLQKRGHDGVVVTWDNEAVGDFDSQGAPIKTLRKVFGTPQVVDYREAAPATEATEQGEQILTPGVAPVTAKEKAEAKGQATLTGGRDPFEGTPLGDMSGRGQGDLVDLARKKQRKRTTPQSLTSWVTAEGGIKEYRGELRGQGITAKVRPGLVNNRTGMTLDDAALRAWEAGFMPEHTSRPSINDFLDALGQDVRGLNKRYAPEDDALVEQQNWVDQVVEIADRLGIPVAGRKIEDIATEIEGLPVGAYSMSIASPPRPGRAPAAVGEELPTTAAMVEPGDRHKGFRQDRFDPDKPATGNAQRRETILKGLMAGLGVPLYQGRVKSRKATGFYRKGIEEVRIKRPADIETVGHEIAHLLDDRIPEIRRQWLPATNANKAIREELRGVSYDKKKLYEGFAEFVRLWATQKEEAQARAPKFAAWFEDFVARSEYGPTLRRTQEQMHSWFEQAALDRARSKIGVAEEINDAITRPVDKFRQGVTDDLHGIMRMERELTGDLHPVGAYETARLTRGKTALIEGALTLGAPKVNPDGSHSFVGKGLKDILDPVTDRLDDFLMYAVGRSARELRSQGRERLFTKAETDAMVALKTPAFDKAFDEYQKWNTAILDFAQAKGLINPTARMMWRRTQYLPFYRVGQPGAVSPVPGDWRGIKALTGGTENLRDILGNMIGNATALIDAALTNEARREVAKLAKRKGGARFMARIPTDERSVRVHRSEIERAILEALGVERKGELDVPQQILVDEIIDGLGGFTALTLRGQTPTGRNVVAVLEEGKPVYYEVADPILYRSLTRLNREARGWFMRLLGGFRRVGQASITLSVDFITANIARDTLMGGVMSRHGFVPIKDSLAGLASRIRQDQNYKDWIANGGGFSSYLLDETAFRKNLERFYRKKGINPRTVMDTPAKLLLGLERIADAFEASTRLGEFKKARKRGEHPRHAAYSAREVSTDFAMRGDWAPIEFFYDTVMFLKAATNGVDRLYRGLAEDPNKMSIARNTGLVALFSAAVYAINRDIPMYADLEDWDRDNHWHFFIPTLETIKAWQEDRPLPAMKDRYIHLRYPKIWEIGAIASITERAIQRIIDADPKGFGKDVLRVLRDTFRVDPIPQAISPIEELRANRLRFFDRPIETGAMRQLEPWARSGPFTSRTLRAMGEKMRHLPRALQVSPAKAEALLRGYLNTWALYGLSLSDAMFFDDKPSLRIDQYPVLRRFYAGEPARHSRHVRELYDTLRDVTEVRRTMRHLDRTNRPDMASEQEYRPENLLFGQLTAAQKQMRGIRKDMAAVVQAPTLKATQALTEARARFTRNRGLIGKAKVKGAWRDMGELKRLLMDDLLRERNQYAKRVMTDVRGRRRELERVK